MHHQIPVSVLFFLEGDGLLLVEVKRQDLEDETDKSKIYFWFLLDKTALHITRLDFISMSSEAAEEKRLFKQGKLSFGSSDGVFENHEGRHLLRRSLPGNLPREVRMKIEEYLRKLFVNKHR